jgi:hypothetical protein
LKYKGTVIDFLKSQLWIFHFWSDNPVNKVIKYGGAIPLILLNKYYVWWGNKPVIPYEDWTILWPVAFVLGFISVLYLVTKKLKEKPATKNVKIVTFRLII